MKLPPTGNFNDHNGTLVPYRLVAERHEHMPVWWRCQIDPHGAGEWNAAGAGRTHTEAMTRARAWWKQYDTAQ